MHSKVPSTWSISRAPVRARTFLLLPNGGHCRCFSVSSPAPADSGSKSRENLASNFRREDLAKWAYLSEPWFHVVFKQATGTAPMEYVRQMRVREAQSLLLRTDLSIQDVGREEGREKGQEEGLFIGRIQSCQRLLQRPVTPKSELAEMPLHHLKNLADTLEGEVASRLA